MVQRKNMESHQLNQCPMKVLSCKECKENVMRKDMKKHITDICSGRICKCPFSKYGCNERVKRKDLNTHLAKNEIKHLNLKVCCIWYYV